MKNTCPDCGKAYGFLDRVLRPSMCSECFKKNKKIAGTSGRDERARADSYSFNGFGTALYGEANYRQDGSFITTQWICAAFLPIFPLRSFRIVREKGGEFYFFHIHGSCFEVIEMLKLQFPQVVRTYAFVAVSIAWWIILIDVFFSRYPNSNDASAIWMFLIWVLAMVAPMVFVSVIRWAAKKRDIKC